MTKHIAPAVILSIALAFGIAVPSRAADITSTIGEYNGTPDFDFTAGDYPLAPVTIGSFSVAIPDGFSLVSGTISGYFGNDDLSSTTAPSDYFVDGGSIEVAECDDEQSFSDACDAGPGPTAWTYTFTPGDLLNLSAEIAANNGNIDFTAVQNFAASIQTGTTTLDLDAETPEPASAFMFCGGLAGIALLRRFRKA
jgi:hypothetical protein